MSVFCVLFNGSSGPWGLLSVEPLPHVLLLTGSSRDCDTLRSESPVVPGFEVPTVLCVLTTVNLLRTLSPGMTIQKQQTFLKVSLDTIHPRTQRVIGSKDYLTYGDPWEGQGSSHSCLNGLRGGLSRTVSVSSNTEGVFP